MVRIFFHLATLPLTRPRCLFHGVLDSILGQDLKSWLRLPCTEETQCPGAGETAFWTLLPYSSPSAGPADNALRLNSASLHLFPTPSLCFHLENHSGLLSGFLVSTHTFIILRNCLVLTFLLVYPISL